MIVDYIKFNNGEEIDFPQNWADQGFEIAALHKPDLIAFEKFLRDNDLEYDENSTLDQEAFMRFVSDIMIPYWIYGEMRYWKIDVIEACETVLKENGEYFPVTFESEDEKLTVTLKDVLSWTEFDTIHKYEDYIEEYLREEGAADYDILGMGMRV